MTAAIRAVPATARSMAWAPFTVASGSVVGLVVAQRPWDGQQLSLGLVRLALVLVAIGAALALDDAAANTLACTPTSLLWRRGVRLALAAGAGAGAAVTVVALFAVGATGGTGGVPLDRLVVEGAGILLLAMALSTAVGGDRGAFLFAVGVLGAVVVQQRWPAWSLFPMAPGAPGWSRAALVWGAVAAASAGALFVFSLDPCFRRPSPRIATRPKRRTLPTTPTEYRQIRITHASTPASRPATGDVRHGGHEPGKSDENDGHEGDAARQREPVGLQTRDQGPNLRGEDGDDPDKGDRHQEGCSGSDKQQRGMSGHRRSAP